MGTNGIFREDTGVVGIKRVHSYEKESITAYIVYIWTDASTINSNSGNIAYKQI